MISLAMLRWAADRGIRLHHIAPGKPIQNAFCESFNGRLRYECLNEYDFISLAHVHEVLGQWRRALQPATAAQGSLVANTRGVCQLVRDYCENSPPIFGGVSGYPSVPVQFSRMAPSPCSGERAFLASVPYGA